MSPLLCQALFLAANNMLDIFYNPVAAINESAVGISYFKRISPAVIAIFWVISRKIKLEDNNWLRVLFIFSLFFIPRILT